MSARRPDVPETFLCRAHWEIAQRTQPRAWAWSPAPAGLVCAEPDCWRRADARGLDRSRHRQRCAIRRRRYYRKHRSEMRAKAREYRAAHREAVNAYARAWQRRNGQRRNAAVQRWRKANAGHWRAYSRQWEAAHRERRNAQARERRAQRKGAS